MDALRGNLSVATTDNTWDPYSILLARDVIKLISRHVTVEKAVQVFDDEITSEIVKVNVKKVCL